MTNINKIVKFQDLEVDKTYTVLRVKPIESKDGRRSHIMEVSKNGETIKVWASNSINDYLLFKNREKDSTKFNFTVRRITDGKLNFVGKLYAKIETINNVEDDGFIELV